MKFISLIGKSRSKIQSDGQTLAIVWAASGLLLGGFAKISLVRPGTQPSTTGSTRTISSDGPNTQTIQDTRFDAFGNYYFADSSFTRASGASTTGASIGAKIFRGAEIRTPPREEGYMRVLIGQASSRRMRECESN